MAAVAPSPPQDMAFCKYTEQAWLKASAATPVLCRSVDPPFNVRQFLTQLAFHGLYPLPLLAVWFVSPDPKTHLRNQHFCYTRFSVVELLLHVAWWLMLALLFLDDTKLCGADAALCDSFYVQAGCVTLIYFLRFVVVAMKYAYMTPPEYCAFLTQRDPELATQWLSHMHLIESWVQIPDDLLAVEVGVTAEEYAVPHFAGLMVSLDGEVEPATQLATDALQLGGAKCGVGRHWPKCVWFATIALPAALPVYKLVVYGELGSGDWQAVVFEACVFVLMMINSRLVTMFCMVGLVDAGRRFRALQFLGNAVLDRAHPLRLDQPLNVRSWIYTRVVVQHLGGRFLKRIEVILGFCFVFAILQLIGLFGVLIYVSVHNDAVSLSVLGPGTIVLICSMTFTFGLLLSHAFLGSRANGLAAKHLETLAWLQLRIRQRIMGDAQLDDARLRELREANTLLDSAMLLLQSHDEMAPVALFGIRASARLLQAMFSALGFALVFTYRLYVVVSIR